MSALELVALLRQALTEPLPMPARHVRERLQACGWDVLAPRFDVRLHEIAATDARG